MLLRWLIGKLGNYHDAEDVLQSCYTRVLTFAEKSEIENPNALIFRVAANLTIDELRKRKRQRATLVEPDPDDDREAVSNVSCGTPSAETALVYREEVRRAVEALDRFPSNVKTAFLLNRVHGKTYTEISKELGVSVSAVEKYMIRALKEVRAYKAARLSDSPAQSGPDSKQVKSRVIRHGARALAGGGFDE